MDALREFLDDLKGQKNTSRHFLGLLHLLIGRCISRQDGTVVSNGMTWRELAVQLKRLRWEPEAAGQLGLEIQDLPVRDRERFWYAVISRAGVTSDKAREDAERLADILRKKGYVVSPPPKT
jgi:hypothetical protein